MRSVESCIFTVRIPSYLTMILWRSRRSSLPGMSSANSAKTTHLDFNFGLKKFAALSSLSFSDFGDLRQGGRRDPQYPDFGKRLFYVDRINDARCRLAQTQIQIFKNNQAIDNMISYKKFFTGKMMW